MIHEAHARTHLLQAAFKVLEKMGSVTTFSVANSVKRGMVIFFGAVAMGTPIGFVSGFGAAVAVLGTAAYWVSEQRLSVRLGFLWRDSRFGCRRFYGVTNSWSKCRFVVLSAR